MSNDPKKADILVLAKWVRIIDNHGNHMLVMGTGWKVSDMSTTVMCGETAACTLFNPAFVGWAERLWWPQEEGDPEQEPPPVMDEANA